VLETLQLPECDRCLTCKAVDAEDWVDFCALVLASTVAGALPRGRQHHAQTREYSTAAAIEPAMMIQSPERAANVIGVVSMSPLPRPHASS
jgi:hypothetical protein